jgi:hypothetical protein
VPPDEGHNQMPGPMPTLFVGIGPWAQETLAEFFHRAAGLTTPIQGPFGLVLADSQGEGLYAGDWLRVSEVRFPDPTLLRERSELVGREEEKLATLLSPLMRRLHSIEPGVEPAPGGRIRWGAYVVLDVSDAAAAACAVRLMRVLRRVDAAVDTTVLALTGRTAAPSSAGDNQWFETWESLLEQLQDGAFAQRLYLLDGCDADKTWFERPEQLHRLGAEFLFYHGLTCRGLLRQSERARTGADESLLNVCGSFGCRTIPADLSMVAQRIAERVAQEDLADLYTRRVPGGWLTSLHEEARLLVEKIASICARAAESKVPSSGTRRDRTAAQPSQNAEIEEALRRTLQRVCSREPLVSLCLFFQLLRPKLARLLSQQRLWDRAQMHRQAIQAFRRQEESTYQPMQTWVGRPQTRWIDRFTPVQPPAPEVAVSRPASRQDYLKGWLILVVGLAAVAAGLSWYSRFLLLTGGLVSLAASVVMTSPVGWARYPRSRLPEGQEIRASAAEVLYRQGVSRRTCLICAALTFAGLAGATWPLGSDPWTWFTGIRAFLVAIFAGTGLALIVEGPRQTRPDRAGDRSDESRPKMPGVQEAPGHVPPPVWRHRAAGLLCLACAWTVVCLGIPSAAAPEPMAYRLMEIAGLAVVAASAGMALRPRMGRAYFVDRMAKAPQPLSGGIGRPFRERELPRLVTALIAWVNRLAVEPDQCLERLRAARIRPHREGTANPARRAGEPGTLLDFVAPDWESQLTQVFRQTIAARAGKPLHTLAVQPALWSECILNQLQEYQERGWSAKRDAAHAGAGGELTSLFALQAVRAWVESLTLAELLSFLHMDLTRFGHLVGRLACPHWPTPRIDPDMNACVIGVGKSLWEALAPLAETPGVPAVTLMDWDASDGKIVILRVVQGLSQGWRGFPGLPGQLHGNVPKPAPVDVRPLTPAPEVSPLARVPA